MSETYECRHTNVNSSNVLIGIKLENSDSVSEFSVHEVKNCKDITNRISDSENSEAVLHNSVDTVDEMDESDCERLHV